MPSHLFGDLIWYSRMDTSCISPQGYNRISLLIRQKFAVTVAWRNGSRILGSVLSTYQTTTGLARQASLAVSLCDILCYALIMCGTVSVPLCHAFCARGGHEPLGTKQHGLYEWQLAWYPSLSYILHDQSYWI
ncbi:uncharacterized protein BO87DRAFT_74676 [Aspergillus neoniger CBS 115656]|uniref:Uncharacterized protein n=1 Tax=Aspergillus neoniger (strain CBS 115656) TaxID=1448310 RepID=A0A318ZTC7_ASPNB|nr:hypothetical protein BO87DRAFT_74676 [Aspergillus neoniger CBS 115656]PYH38962.1 hypothetical protein BO87DRAFT_74676 [Aspergillus neoniger CBS 115656]